MDAKGFFYSIVGAFMGRWHIEATREHVERIYGRQQCDLVRPCLQSIVDRQNYARYHYHEANNLFIRFAHEHLAETSLIMVAWSPDDDTRFDFQNLITKVGASVLACIQSMHAVADILAHTVYYSLGLNLTNRALPEAAISAYAVLELTSKTPGFAEIYQLLNTQINAGQFSHLTALVNHSKHRSIIRTSVSEDLTGQAPERHTLKLSGFHYKKRQYPEVDARTFIQSEYDRQAVLVIDIGNALNAVLQTKTP